MKVFCAVNDSGYRVGEGHHNAKLTDRDVDTIFRLREEGLPYRRIALMMDVSVRTVRDILAYKRRAQCGVHFRAVQIKQKDTEIHQEFAQKQKAVE